MGRADTIDADEVIAAIAKTVAELTSVQDGTVRQQLIEQLMRAAGVSSLSPSLASCSFMHGPVVSPKGPRATCLV